MEPLIGTPQCPHLGFDGQGGVPCCHADDLTRQTCGRDVPNPAAQGTAAVHANVTGVEMYFCTALGADAVPAAALRLQRQEKARAKVERRKTTSYQPPRNITGRTAPKPTREHDPDADPIIPTYTIRQEGRRIGPNEKCPCGSGKKFKKCCGP